MDLQLDISPSIGYKSASQRARRVTEAWAEANLYCLACPAPHLDPLGTSRAVLDFRCPDCAGDYQLKAKSQPFKGKVTNSAYGAKMQAMQAGEVPNYAFLHYSPVDWVVEGLFVIPGHFFTPAVIEQRRPLRSSARRAGWVGSNILLDVLPPEARVVVANARSALDPGDVRREWQRFAFLGDDVRARGGWGADVLACIRRLQASHSGEFTLREFYLHFEAELAGLHPDNHNVQAKIRQQLQVLRDGGVLHFLGHGHYRMIS